MVRSHIRTCAAAAVSIGLMAGSTGAPAETAAPPAVTAESAAVLAETIDAALRQWFPPTGATAGYRWEGQVQATAAGDHYDVAFPALSITSKDGSRLGLGSVRLALAPDADGAWEVGATLPGQITLLAADGSSDGDVTIGAQHFSGRWVPALGTFVKIDGSYDNLQAASPKDSSRLTIGGIALRTDLTEAPAGRWTGPSTLTINKLDMVDRNGAPIVHLGGAAFELTLSGMDLKQIVAVSGQLAAATEAKAGKGDEAKAGKGDEAKAGKGDEADTGKDDEENVGETLRRVALFQDLLNGILAKVRVNDLAVTSPHDGSAVALGQLAIEGGIERTQGRSTVTIGYDHDGLRIKPALLPPDLLPEKAGLSIAVSELPSGDVLSLLQRLEEARASGDEKATGDLTRQFAASFYQPGVRLGIKTLHIDTPAAALTLEGEARLDNTTARGGVAGFDMVIRGLDPLLKRMKPAPGAKIDEDTQNLLAGLAMLQAMGAPGKDEGGRDIRTYKLQMDADGKVLLNGADLTAMLQLPQGPDAKHPESGAASGRPATGKPAAP